MVGLVDAVFRGLKYMFCYKALVNDLNSEIGKLNIEKDNMSRKIEEEKESGKIIKDYVSKWQKDVEEIQESAEELSPSCSCIQRLPIPDPISRFRIGRNAVKKAEIVTKLTISGKEYLTGEIAHLPPVINLPKSDTTFEEFQSRKDAYRKLWDALVDEDGPLIHGIYGMAGVGKTRMMEQLWEDAMKKNIFNKVVRVNVGNENLDNLKLQDQIAGHLKCKLESEVVESRASQLEDSLRNGGKILLILDDVWTKIPLNDIIGAPFRDGCSSSKGSKILLTSRQSEVCLNNECEHVVEIETLSLDEALYLFKKTVGPHTINSLPDKSMVEKVCDKCGGLPLLIHAVGKALKHRTHNSWKDAHDQLMKGKFERIPGVHPHVYTGSRLIPDGESRVRAMVDYLKISSLLLYSEEGYDEIKVHDIIRDVARSIAFTDSNYAFLQVTCNSRYLPSNVSYCDRRFLRLDSETNDVHFVEHLVCPDLHTLWLQSNYHPQQFSDGFFSMFPNLSFLVLQKVKISLEQFSLQSLGSLGTLTLSKCNIRKTDVSLFPKSLKTLCIWYCDLPSPLDVANLKYLRKLEILDGKPILVMVNVISSLSSLEELHIPYGFINDRKEYHVEPIVMEISKLTHLTSLQFQFVDDGTFQVTDIFSNIDRYDILVTKSADLYRAVSSTRSIELRVNHWKSWEGLMVRAENLILRDNDVELSSICNVDRRAFVDLKILDICRCHNMGHIASISDDEIQPATYFSKLTILKVSRCSKLKYLFCNNIAKSLVQLQELDVQHCDSLEAIIMNEGGTSDEEIIIFSQLKSLTISDMRSLASFYAEKKDMQCTEPSPQHQPLFDGMVAFPSLEVLIIESLLRISVIWGKDCYNDTLSSFCKLNHLRVLSCDKLEIVIPQAMLHRLNYLKYIHVSRCNSLRTMFPPAAASDLTHLQKMIVEECGGMREIIEAGEQVITDGILFPEMTFLKLSQLRSLMSFWCYQSGKANTCKVSLRLPRLSLVFLGKLPDIRSLFHGANFEFHMPALNEVEVDSCGLSTLFTKSMFRNFQLQKLKVRNCELLENIVEDLKGDETCDKIIITLSQLTAVEFENLPNLKSFFYNANYEFHLPVIKKVKVLGCGLSSALFTRSVFKNFKLLEELSVCDCELLEGIFEDARGDETLDTSDKIITLNRVSVLLLQGLPRFKSIFYGATYKCYMPALKNVKIVGCEISVLFTCLVFREIRRLEKLHVSHCKLLEHIVEEVGDDETSEIDGKGITSSQLSSITLEYLPNLKSYGHTLSYVFNMPKLQNFRLIQCPQMEYFTSSKTKTSLVRVTSDWCIEGFQDLNDFIRQNHKRGSYLNYCAGESSYSSQDLGTQSEIIEEEKPNETETDQHESSV